MAKTVRVTSAQVAAAKLAVKRAAAAGRYVSRGITAIANARRGVDSAADGGWAVTKPGSSRASAHTDTDGQADRAREIVRDAG